MPVYLIESVAAQDKQIVVTAPTAAAALRFVARRSLKVTTINAERLVVAVREGTPVLDALEDAAPAEEDASVDR